MTDVVVVVGPDAPPLEVDVTGDPPPVAVTVAEPGPPGATGPEGPPGPQGPPGVDGDDGADSTVPGPPGPAGAAGAPGATGPTGPPGAASTVPGPTGPTGPTGATGSQGPQGVKGDTGATGTTGAQGPPGTTGAQGVKGDKGDPGTAGSQGPAGTTGAQGPAGPGVIAGGTTDQLLAKASATDYATKWVNAPTGGGGGLTVAPVAWMGQAAQSVNQGWFYPSTFYLGGAAAGGASIAQRFHLVPLFVPRAVTVARIRAQCGTLEAGSTLRLGIYAADDALNVGDRVADWGTVSGAAAGEKIISGLSTALTAGWYWLATWASNHAVARWHKWNVTGSSTALWSPGGASVNLGRNNWGRLAIGVDYTAGLPSTTAATWTDHVNDGNPPAVWLEAAP